MDAASPPRRPLGGIVDFSNFKVSDWLMVGGGLAMLILGFALPWSTVSIGGISDSGDGPFDYFLTGGIAWILTVSVGAVSSNQVTIAASYAAVWANAARARRRRVAAESEPSSRNSARTAS